MKKSLKKIKTSIIAIWITIASFFSKVMGQVYDQFGFSYPIQSLYADPGNRLIQVNQEPTFIDKIIKITPRLLIPVTLAFGIISFLKIKKIDDEVLKKKKTKRAVIVITILIIITLLLFLWLAMGIKKINFSMSFGDI